MIFSCCETICDQIVDESLVGPSRAFASVCTVLYCTYYLARESGRTFLVPPPPLGKNSTARVRISTADDANYSFQNQIRSTCRKLRRTFPVGYSTASQMRRQQQRRLPSEVAVVVIDAFESLLSISNHAAPLKTTRYDPSQQKWQLLSAWEQKHQLKRQDQNLILIL